MTVLLRLLMLIIFVVLMPMIIGWPLTMAIGGAGLLLAILPKGSRP